MGIFIDKNTRAIVQGITGTQGRFHTFLMLDYGTKIVAGVTPGRGGMEVHNVPVYDTIVEALSEHEAEASIIFVPAPFALDATLEALEGGIKTIVIITEGIPIRDSIKIMARAKKRGATIIGPNTPGVITAGESKLGIMPAQIFNIGSIGLASRSGTLTYEVAAAISRGGFGISTCVGIGGDPIVGLNFVEVLERFEGDPFTEAIVLIGEIGGDMEERAADSVFKEEYPKPIAAFIAGRTAVAGKRMGHAGAIIHGRAGTAQSKIKAFREAGIKVAERPGEIAKIMGELLK